jgi:WD40 repeat protein
MPKIRRTLTSIFQSLMLILTVVDATIASPSLIYVAEPIKSNKSDSIKTVISKFTSDGTELNKFVVDGTFATVSPDGKQVVFLEQKTDEPWKIVLADSDGKESKYLDVIKNQKKNILYPMPVRFAWSPDSKKIAIIFSIQTHVDVAVFILKTNELKGIYSGRSGSSEEAYFYKINWLPDNKHILIAGSDGTRIINDVTKEETIISKESVIAYLSGNGKEVLYVPQVNQIHLDAGVFKPPFEIFQFDTEKEKRELLMSSDSPPMTGALSQDGRYLVFQRLPIKEAAIFKFDLLQKKISRLDTKGYFLLPKKFSPFSSTMILCQGFKEDDNTTQSGILNLDNGEFKVLNKTSSKGFEGEGSLILFMGFDWYDWR